MRGRAGRGPTASEQSYGHADAVAPAASDAYTGYSARHQPVAVLRAPALKRIVQRRLASSATFIPRIVRAGTRAYVTPAHGIDGQRECASSRIPCASLSDSPPATTRAPAAGAPISVRASAASAARRRIHGPSAARPPRPSALAYRHTYVLGLRPTGH